LTLKYYKETLGCALWRNKPFKLGDKDSKKPLLKWGGKKHTPGESLEVCEAWMLAGNSVSARPGPGLLVVDVDVVGFDKDGGRIEKEGAESWRRLVERFNLPETARVESPTGGRHYYFRVPEIARDVPVGQPGFPGLDFIHVDRLFNVAGSPHWKGGRYKYAGGDIEEMPAACVEFLTKKPTERVTPAANGSLNADAWASWRREALDRFPFDTVFDLTGETSSGGEWYVCRDPDSDTGDRNPSAGVATGQGQAERGKFQSFRSGICESLFDYLIRKKFATDWKNAAEFVAERSGVPLPLPRRPKPPADDFSAIDDEDGRYGVNATLELRDRKREAIKGLKAAGDVYVFKKRLSQVARFDDKVTIEPMSSNHLLSKLDDSCQFYKPTKQGRIPVEPDDRVVQVVREDWNLWAGLQELRGIATGPQLLPDGSVIFERGINKRGKILLEWPASLNYPDLPTGAEIDKVGREIVDLSCDFPFLGGSGSSHQAAWFALVLTIVCRSALAADASVPLFFIDGSDRGVGKSNLAKIASLIASGRLPESTGWPENNEEMQKLLVTLAMNPGRSFVFFDNVATSRPFGHAALDSVITSGKVRGRILGGNRLAEAEISSTFIATGNRLVLNKGSDIERRLAVIRLETNDENPEDRQGFRHGNESELLAHVEKHWPRFYMGCLAICKRVIDTNPTVTLKPWGSFSEWSQLIRRATISIGLPDPGGCRDYVRAELDEKKDDRRVIFSALRALQLTGPQTSATAREIFIQLLGDKHAEARDILEALGGRQGNEASRYGRALTSLLGQVSDGYKLRKALKNGTKAFFLEFVQ